MESVRSVRSVVRSSLMNSQASSIGHVSGALGHSIAPSLSALTDTTLPQLAKRSSSRNSSRSASRASSPAAPSPRIRTNKSEVEDTSPEQVLLHAPGGALGEKTLAEGSF